MRILLFLLLLFLQLPLNAQPGCTDPQATNYDPLATENDGSCFYPATDLVPTLIGELPVDMEECSGLAFFNDQLWTNMDGGDLDRIYTLDTMTAEKLQTIIIPNADNLDWEDLAEDEEHLYIGDFGNNSGGRTDLRIYKIKKSDLISGTVSPELIEFSFSDQTNFNHDINDHNFDCEAFFHWGDSLHLFSKNWADFKTRHYVMPSSPGTHIAELRDSLEAQGQITAADITEEGTALLLGYNVVTSETFLWLLFDFDGNNVFSGNKRRISMGSALTISQPEGIVFRNNSKGYICSERFSVLPQKLFSFDVREWIENPVSQTEIILDENSLSVFPNPASNRLNINWDKLEIKGPQEVKVFNAIGELVFSKNSTQVIRELNISNLPKGKYWLVISDTSTHYHSSFQKM